jgi:fumarate reductase iron-sulfur subunit
VQITIQKSTASLTYDIASLRVTTLLSALYEIKAKLDPELTFDAGCRSGVCGRCTVRVNDRETLACSHKIADGDRIEPLRYHPILRDLKVGKRKAHKTLQEIIHPKENTQTNSQPIQTQTNCILCDSCYSACPVLAVDSEFLGPFALTRAYRYLGGEGQNKEQDQGQARGTAPTIDKIQAHGIWDCTLCGECTAVCPQGIDSKSDILALRSLSIQAGYSDPNFGTMDFGTPDFGGGFGF